MAEENEKLFLDLSQNNDQGSEEQNQEQGSQEQNQEAGSEQSQEGSQEQNQEQGSQEQNQDNQEAQELVIEDSKLMEILSERLGRKIDSFDELTKKEEKQLNPQIQAIAEWSERTGRPVEDWVNYNKDYSKMSDMDKAREILTLKYPTFSPQEVQLELNKYSETEDDLEDEVAIKNLELKKLIANEGKLLDNLKLELGKPVEGFGVISDEIKEQLDFAKAAKESYDRALDNQKEYDSKIVESVNNLGNLDINLEEGLELKYNLSPEDKKELPSFLSTMPHWHNADGSFNHSAVVSDALKIRNFDKIVKMAYEQGKASGLEKSYKDANNITLDSRSAASEQPDGANKGIIIEGYEKIVGQGVKAKFGKSFRK